MERRDTSLIEEKLRPYLKPAEVFITNTKRDQGDRVETYSWPAYGIFAEDVPTLNDEIKRYESLGYTDVRVLDVAFRIDGTPSTSYVAIVGVISNIAESAEPISADQE